MARESFAKTVFDTLGKLSAASGEATVTDLSHTLTLQTRAAHKRMLNALSDHLKAGRVKRVRQGVYAMASSPAQPDIQSVMWRILRMRKRVSVDDLVEMAGASASYAAEWLRMLERRGVARREGGHADWRLIHDTVEMPCDTEKADRFRELRKKKKQQALADLAAAQKLIGKAHQAITEMED